MTSERPFFPVPKPEGGGKKKKGKAADAAAQPPAEPVSRTRKEINASNQAFGKSAERSIAKKTGGYRVPLSGAVKNSVKQLEGDVRVRDADGKRDVFVLEVKTSATVSPKGEKSFTLKKAVLDQMVSEADLAGAIGAVVVHWKGEDYEDDYFVMKAEHFYRWLDVVKTAMAEGNT